MAWRKWIGNNYNCFLFWRTWNYYSLFKANRSKYLLIWYVIKIWRLLLQEILEPEIIKGIKEQLEVNLEEKSVRTIKHSDELSSLILEGFYVFKDFRMTSSNTHIQIII